jgi:hypothetical protein
VVIPYPGLKPWAGRPCPCGTADRFSSVEEVFLFEFDSMLAEECHELFVGGGV